jgi:hypothetical protein
MNGESSFVLDSNFVLDYLKGFSSHIAFMREHIEHDFCVSVITEMELFSFHDLSEDERRCCNHLFRLSRLRRLMIA